MLPGVQGKAWILILRFLVLHINSQPPTMQVEARILISSAFREEENTSYIQKQTSTGWRRPVQESEGSQRQISPGGASDIRTQIPKFRTRFDQDSLDSRATVQAIMVKKKRKVKTGTAPTSGVYVGQFCTCSVRSISHFRDVCRPVEAGGLVEEGAGAPGRIPRGWQLVRRVKEDHGKVRFASSVNRVANGRFF